MIKYTENDKSFFLEGADFTYAMRVDSNGYLTHTYYGAKIARADLGYYKQENVRSFNPVIPGTTKAYADIMQEYGTANLGDFREPAMIPRGVNGDCTADLRFAGYFILPKKSAVKGIPTSRGGETLVIRLRDGYNGLSVYLYYTVYEKENIITRRAKISNTTGDTVFLERALSYTLDFYGSGYEVLTLAGHHAKEKYPQRSELHQGIYSVGNIRGTTSANHANFIALLIPGTDEEKGEVFASSLMYSGSHYESAEVDESGRVRLSSGINPGSFRWKLDAGEEFETPEAVLCYSHAGLGLMTRQYHDFFRRYVISPKWAYARRPIVLNSWEGMHFSFNSGRIFETVDKLKGSGIDLFVLDDGWFGARDNDKAGLGDWYCNEKKLPGGLRAIADRCAENGLGFGLWIEPEMVNPDSDLYREHPDWAVGIPGRPGVPSRNQFVLDFSRQDVVDHIKKVIGDVIAGSGACYIKWDMNRPLTENFSHLLPADRQGEFQHRYMLGVYELAEYLTKRFPDILFEGCSGGGGRFDGAMLAYFPQIWTSDNTDADDRSKIQYGTTLVFPLSASSNHVSISPNIRNGRATPLGTRTNIAYLGTFGYEFDVNRFPAEEFARIPADTARYRTIDGLIREGDVYRGNNRHDGNDSLVCVVSKDKKRAVAVYCQALNPHKMNPRFRIPGLDPDRLYRVEELNLMLPGSVLVNLGVTLPRYRNDFGSTLLTITAVE